MRSIRWLFLLTAWSLLAQASLTQTPKGGFALNHAMGGSLAGLTGTVQINIDSAGKHTYMFDYTLPQ
jgi:hypothetical protein